MICVFAPAAAGAPVKGTEQATKMANRDSALGDVFLPDRIALDLRQFRLHGAPRLLYQSARCSLGGATPKEIR
jgi:hypothetical protein